MRRISVNHEHGQRFSQQDRNGKRLRPRTVKEMIRHIYYIILDNFAGRRVGRARQFRHSTLGWLSRGVSATTGNRRFNAVS